MFYCDPCAKNNDWPNYDFLPVSYGQCEVCSHAAACYDVPSNLPMPGLTPGQQAQNDELEAIRSIKTTIEKRS